MGFLKTNANFHNLTYNIFEYNLIADATVKTIYKANSALERPLMIRIYKNTGDYF